MSETAGRVASAPTPPPPPLSPSRVAAVDEAIAQWTRQLIDLSGNNRLLYFRTLKVGTWEPTATPDQVDDVALDALLGGRKVRLANLVPEDEDRRAVAKRLRNIVAKARENDEERGLHTLSLSLGMATWEASGTKATPAAPVLLQPLAARPRDTAGEDFDLQLDGDAEVNPTLLHYLATEHAVVIDGDDLLTAAAVDDTQEIDGPALFERLAKECHAVRGFRIEERVVVANFSFEKMPMVRDLQTNRDQLLSHDLIAAVAGDSDAQRALNRDRPEVDPSLPDRTPPQNEYLVLPADASQNHVINRALAGESLVVQGPPGTGKSQTIANLIAALMASGKRVLFVAEKRAAIDAVVTRLASVGLTDVVLDLHSATKSRKAVVAQIGEALDAASSAAEPDLDALHRGLVADRDVLIEHDRAMNEVRSPWNRSLFDVQSSLFGWPADARSDVVLPPAVVTKLSEADIEERCGELPELLALRRRDHASGSAWVGLKLTSAADARSAHGWAQHLADATTTAVQLDGRCSAATRVPSATTLEELVAHVALWRGAAELLTVVSPDAFVNQGELQALVEELRPAAASVGTFLFKSVASSSYRAARDRAAMLIANSNERSRTDIVAILDRAIEADAAWRALGAQPAFPAELDQIAAAAFTLENDLPKLLPHLGAQPGPDLGRLATVLGDLASDLEGAERQPRQRQIEAAFKTAGLGEVLDDLLRRDVEAEPASSAVRYVWLRSIYRLLRSEHLAAFTAEAQSARQRSFQQRDREHVAKTAQRVVRRVAERAVEARNEHSDQAQLLAKQVRLKRRHLPLRRLVASAPDVLTALKPCWTMSPLLVSQLLPGDRSYFDVVIFDEASQVRPADAVPALMRAPQAIIAGDSRQLPPTTFFATETGADLLDEAEDDGDLDLSLTQGFESVLDVLDSMLATGALTWHYRSRDERLISFSNLHIYSRSLTTFPGIATEGSVRHELVDGVADAISPTDSAGAEVTRVLDLVLDHARTRPNESLGVIALGIKHANRIEEALRLRLPREPDARSLARYFDERRDERFFVKNLERVQGDERDAIILSIGVPKQADGRLHYRFGPINQAGGERRLNVAVTRARNRMTVVSSFSHEDMDPKRSSAEGVAFLRGYLRFASSGGADVGDIEKAPPELNPFELHVQRRLEALGVPLVPQFGASGYRIDFAAAHPDQPGRMVLAIECDGATYHSSPTARDRDRLRQEVLERLGWTFHRIWSTAWFQDPAEETKRAHAAWLEAVAAADDADAAQAQAVAAGLGDVASDLDSEVEAADDVAPPPRVGRPPAARGDSINDYSDADLDKLIRWLRSDTLLRTDDELIDLGMEALGFKRRGKRIVERLQAAIDRTEEG